MEYDTDLYLRVHSDFSKWEHVLAIAPDVSKVLLEEN